MKWADFDENYIDTNTNIGGSTIERLFYIFRYYFSNFILHIHFFKELSENS